MHDSQETIQERETSELEAGEPDAFVRLDNAHSILRALTPPPPSAPSEFLKAQNHPLRDEVAQQAGPAPVTPPPASVPAEFLVIQQSKDPSARSPDRLMEAFLESMSSPPREFETGIWPVQWSEEEQEEQIEAEPESASAEVAEPVRIRGFPLTRGEEITRVLLPDKGLSDTLPRSGQALILTSRRLIAFRGVDGFRDTHMARTSDIRQFSVRAGQRNWTAILQGLLMTVGGGLLYLIVGYWLAGQISGPNVPVLNIDVAPLIALLIILAGLLVLLQNYFTRPDGAVIFRGTGLEIAFPFRSALDVQQIYEFVDSVQNAAQRSSGPSDAETLEEAKVFRFFV